jgi:hypothetical protein
MQYSNSAEAIGLHGAVCFAVMGAPLFALIVLPHLPRAQARLLRHRHDLRVIYAHRSRGTVLRQDLYHARISFMQRTIDEELGSIIPFAGPA